MGGRPHQRAKAGDDGGCETSLCSPNELCEDKNATQGFCLHTTQSLQRSLGAGAECVNRPNLFPKRTSLCNFWGCLQLVQNQANCSMTRARHCSAGEAGTRAGPPRLCASGMLLPTKAAEVQMCLFFLASTSVQAESPLCCWEELKYKIAGTYLCLLLPKSPKETAAALPTSSGTGSQCLLGMPASEDHRSFFPR